MGKVWTDEEVQAEIREAVKIVQEDRERAEYGRLHGKYGQQKEEDKDKEGDKDPKNPPPAKDKEGDKDENPPKVRRSIWWGEIEDE